MLKEKSVRKVYGQLDRTCPRHPEHSEGSPETSTSIR